MVAILCLRIFSLIFVDFDNLKMFLGVYSVMFVFFVTKSAEMCHGTHTTSSNVMVYNGISGPFRILLWVLE